MSLQSWAIRHGVSPNALSELQIQLGLLTLPAPPEAEGKSEAFVASQLRLEASRKGVRLFRNNSGALMDEGGRLVRFGLGNDSEAVNKVFKSADFVGWRRVVIGPQHVGYAFAQAVARETKPPTWQYTGKGREVQQRAFLDMLNADGGDGAFVTREGSL